MYKPSWVSFLWKTWVLIKQLFLNTIVTLPRDMRKIFLTWELKRQLYLEQRRNATVGKLFDETVKKYPNKVCYYFEEERWTFKQIQTYANQVGNYFQSQGYKKGDCIALMMENRPKFIFIWLGLSKIGVITSWININLRHQSLLHCLRAGNAQAIIFGQECSDAIKEIVGTEELPEHMKYFTLGKTSTHRTSPFSGFQPVDFAPELFDASPRNPIPNDRVNFEDVFCYIFTSGTTGLPKAAVLTHSRVITGVFGPHYMVGLSMDDILYTSLPLYHIQGGIVGACQPLFFGMSQVLVRKFSVSRFWKDCIRYDVTVAQYLGVICRYLLNQPVTPEDKAHHVKKMFGNGMKTEVWVPFLERFNNPLIIELYGATEGNCQMANFEGIVGPCGSLPYGILGNIFQFPLGIFKVDEETGELLRDRRTGFAIPCKPNERGELLGMITNEPMREFTGYTDAIATNKKTVRYIRKDQDRYFRSGDILMKDELNYMYFLDRLGSSFRWKGEIISSEEVTSVINNSIGMKDANVVVFGVPVPHTDGKAGMVIISNVSKEHIQGVLKKLNAAVKKFLPTYARPLFVRFVEKIDFTGTFKFQTNSLQQQGFNISIIANDPIYYLEKGSYEPLDATAYQNITDGNMKF